MRLIFLGPPGAGKGTQAAILARELNIPHISTGDLLRSAIAQKTDLGIQAQTYLEAGELVPDDLIMAMMRERLAKPDAVGGWILDGFPRNLSQARALDRLLQILGQSHPQAMNFNVATESLIARMLQRGRKDDNENVIRRRLEVYQEKTTPLISFYKQRRCLIDIDGNMPLEGVSQSIREKLSLTVPV
jgi:adenylate kinase